MTIRRNGCPSIAEETVKNWPVKMDQQQTNLRFNNDGKVCYDNQHMLCTDTTEQCNNMIHQHSCLHCTLSTFASRSQLGTLEKISIQIKDFWEPYVHVNKLISQSCGQGSLLHKCQSYFPDDYIALHCID